MPLIGLTGGIAAGKSLVTDYLKSKGVLVVDADPDRWIVFSVPLLFESGFDKVTDRVVVVYADETIQLQRLMKRTGLTTEEARKRIEAQMPIEEKKMRVDDVIDNSGTPEETYRQVDQWLGAMNIFPFGN